MFKDHFSEQGAAYARYRPRYPDALFEHLASVAPGQGAAWDCATGTGQAALGLAGRFRSVIATDASEEQIRHAVPHERITYRVAPAEKPGLAPGSIDLVTVAQALHWLDRRRFYAQARRALVPGGVLAVWCYGLISASSDVDRVVQRFYSETLGPYWPPERRLVETGYRSIEFPFQELEAPALHHETRWTLADLLGYLRTWSAARRFRAENGCDPVAGVANPLAVAWGDPESPRVVRWSIHLRIGRPYRRA